MSMGWIYEPIQSPYDVLLFYNSMKKHIDSFCYTPIAIARREEIGTKYRFLCLAYDKADPDAASQFASIEIYKPMTGLPYPTRLHRLLQDNWLQ